MVDSGKLTALSKVRFFQQSFSVTCEGCFINGLLNDCVEAVDVCSELLFSKVIVTSCIKLELFSGFNTNSNDVSLGLTTLSLIS